MDSDNNPGMAPQRTRRIMDAAEPATPARPVDIDRGPEIVAALGGVAPRDLPPPEPVVDEETRAPQFRWWWAAIPVIVLLAIAAMYLNARRLRQERLREGFTGQVVTATRENERLSREAQEAFDLTVKGDFVDAARLGRALLNDFPDSLVAAHRALFAESGLIIEAIDEELDDLNPGPDATLEEGLDILNRRLTLLRLLDGHYSDWGALMPANATIRAIYERRQPDIEKVRALATGQQSVTSLLRDTVSSLSSRPPDITSALRRLNEARNLLPEPYPPLERMRDNLYAVSMAAKSFNAGDRAEARKYLDGIAWEGPEPKEGTVEARLRAAIRRAEGIVRQLMVEGPAAPKTAKPVSGALQALLAAGREAARLQAEGDHNGAVDTLLAGLAPFRDRASLPEETASVVAAMVDRMLHYRAVGLAFELAEGTREDNVIQRLRRWQLVAMLANPQADPAHWRRAAMEIVNLTGAVRQRVATRGAELAAAISEARGRYDMEHLRFDADDDSFRASAEILKNLVTLGHDLVTLDELAGKPGIVTWSPREAEYVAMAHGVDGIWKRTSLRYYELGRLYGQRGNWAGQVKAVNRLKDLQAVERGAHAGVLVPAFLPDHSGAEDEALIRKDAQEIWPEPAPPAEEETDASQAS